MVIVQIIGGTASQMSAFIKGYLVAKKLDKELVLDVADYINGYKFVYALDYFHLKYRKLKYMHRSVFITTEQVVPKEFMEQYQPYVIRTGNISFDEVCREAEAHKDSVIYLVGETGDLPDEIPEARDLFQVDDNAFLNYFKQEIQGKQSVAVHVRRTDFVPMGISNEYAYYNAAIRYVQERIPDAVFYIFSDDLDAVKAALGTKPQYRYVNIPGGFVTDVVELLCMSLCNHRIMTLKSGFSTWSARLNDNPNAMNIGFSEEQSDKYIILNKAMVTEYIKQMTETLPAMPLYDWATEETKILNALDTGEYVEEALWSLCKMSFDSGSLTEEQFDKLYYYYETLLILKEQYEQAEQAILKHLERCPDSVEANCNMAIVKKLLGKNMAAYIYASRICRETAEPAYTKMFVENFYHDTTFAYFKKLCTMPRMHIIVCPTTEAHFYQKHSISMAIVLKLLGHEVSVVNGGASENQETESGTEDWWVNLLMGFAYEPDSSYRHGIKVYPFVNVEGMDIYVGIIKRLLQSTTLPTVIIGRALGVFPLADEYPMLYWDFSCENDIDTQRARLFPGWEKRDVLMRLKATAILTTDKTTIKEGAAKTRVVEPYVREDAYWFDEEPCSASNYIDEECFLRFVFDAAELATEICK